MLFTANFIYILLIHLKWRSSSFRRQIFPILIIQLFSPQIQQAPGPDFRKVRKYMNINSFVASGDLSTADNLCKQFGVLDAMHKKYYIQTLQPTFTGLRSAVGNVSGYRCMSDCRSRGCEFDPGPVPYFCGD